MSDWVFNKLYIVGPSQDIAVFKDKCMDSYCPAQIARKNLKLHKTVWVSNSYFPAREKGDSHEAGKNRSKPVVVDLSFNRMVPVPLAVTKKPYIKLKFDFVEDPIIPWCFKHWGCKWDVQYPNLVRESKRRLFYTFSTPLRPPLEWLKWSSRQYPRLHFSLHFIEDPPWIIIQAFNGRVCLVNDNTDQEDFK